MSRFDAAPSAVPAADLAPLAARLLPWVLLGLLAARVALGIANVLLSLPLPLAVAHNAGAALLVATMVWINYRVRAGAAVAPRRTSLPRGQPARA